MEWDDVKTQLIYQLLMFFFFILVSSVGGVLAGQAARRLSEDPRTALGSMFAGGLFAGVPLLMSAIMLRAVNPFLFWLQAVLLLLVFLGTLLLPARAINRVGAGTVIAIGLGIPILGLAAVVGTLGFQNGDPLFGLCWAGIAGFVGLGFLASGLQSLISGKPLALKSRGGGTMDIVPEGSVPNDEDDADDLKVSPKPKSRAARKVR